MALTQNGSSAMSEPLAIAANGTVQSDEENSFEQLKQELNEAKAEIARLRSVVEEQSYFNQPSSLYAVRILDREKEEDPHVAFVMHSSQGVEGPWHDMVMGSPDWCWEVFEALSFVQYSKMEKRREEEEWLRKEFAL
jgi:hypothetical protein